MTDLMQVIKERRSIRKFEQKAVRKEDLNQILEAVRWAPSWTNCQPWELIVVKDQAVKEKLQASLPPKGNPAIKAVVQAPVLLVLCGKTKISGYYKGEPSTKLGDWFMFDLGIAAQNICLSAHTIGLGTVIVGLFDHDKANEAVNVPEGYELVAMIPLGYPVTTGSAPPRKEVDEFTHHETF